MNISKQEYSKNPLLGAVETAIFMPQFTERFGNDFQSMLKSFLVPLIMMPLTYIGLYLSHHEQPEIAHLPYSQVASMFFIKSLFVMGLSFLIIYGFAKVYERLDNFYLTITAGNWSGVFPTLLFLPVLCSMWMGVHSWEEAYPISIVFAIYGYAVAAFVLTRGLNIPWEMGGFLAICLLAVNETAFDILYWFAAAPN